MRGIDVSKHQGAVDWRKVKAAGIEFAVIRAGFGMYENQTDPRFAENMAGAKEAGIPVGIYWYSYAASADEARREAEICRKVIEPWREQIALPVFFDQEYEPAIKAQTRAVRTEMCRVFMQSIQEAGFRAGLYCSLDWYLNWLDRSRLAEWPVWIAHYAKKCGYAGENLIAWQYSARGRVDGVSGDVDLDEGYEGLLPARRNGWGQSGKGWYWYENGRPVKNVWRKADGWWYRLGPDGRMLTGLQEVDGRGYCLNPARGTVGGVYVPEGACIITDENGAIL